VVLRTLLCRECGFVTVSPRPSEEDIDAKYRFLQREEGDIGGQAHSGKAKRLDERRAERIYRSVVRHTGTKALQVLDFGGGNGKLLVSFQRRGHTCHLVDYSLEPLPGVEKIGDTLEDLPDGAAYDLILCSHVIEHLGDPRKTVRKLAACLQQGGILYGEVPIDVWGGVDIRYDPVTHVNFFTPHSFELLFETIGLGVLESREIGGTYSGGRVHASVVLARKGRQGLEGRSPRGADQALRFLHPTIWMRVQRAWRLRRVPGITRIRHWLPRRGVAARPDP
jgi:SAM-dependent methyltransferase